MKVYQHKGRALAAFHLEGDVVRIEWLDPSAEKCLVLDSLLTADGSRELTPADGKRFYDRLEHAYPGSVIVEHEP